VNPNPTLRYTPALTTPGSSFGTGAEVGFLTCFDDEEDGELAGWLVCARTKIVVQAVIAKIRIGVPTSHRARAMPLMLPSYKDGSRLRSGDVRVVRGIAFKRKRGGPLGRPTALATDH
jgi:hypothetical protein